VVIGGDSGEEDVIGVSKEVFGKGLWEEKFFCVFFSTSVTFGCQLQRTLRDSWMMYLIEASSQPSSRMSKRSEHEPPAQYSIAIYSPYNDSVSLHVLQ